MNPTLRAWLDRISRHLLRYAFAYLVAVGIFAISAGYYVEESLETRLGRVFTELGSAILVGGIFSVLLKTLQYLGVFQEELQRALYNPRFLGSRNDLEKLWTDVTRQLYTQHFPKIQEEFEEVVRESYLTNRMPYYVEDFQIALHVTHESEQSIVLNIVNSGTYVATDVSTSIVYEQSSTLRESKLGVFKFNELKSLKIDGVERLEGSKKERTENEKWIVQKYRVVLTGRPSYRIERRFEMRLNLAVDPSYVIAVDVICKNLTIDVTFPESVGVHLFTVGTIHTFEEVPVPDPQRQAWRLAGILLPRQGGRLVFGNSVVAPKA